MISRKVEWIVWGGLALVVVTIAVLFFASVAVSSRSKSASSSPLPVYGVVPAFALTNQFGVPVTLDRLRGQIWVADIIFTRCPGPCAQMTQRMSELQAAFSADPSVRLISLTTDPEFDTPPILARYAARFGAETNRWWFLTGSKEQISQLAIGGLKLTALDKTPADRSSEEDLFIHSTISVLVDGAGRLRGVFETLQPEAFQELIRAVERLRREKSL